MPQRLQLNCQFQKIKGPHYRFFLTLLRKTDNKDQDIVNKDHAQQPKKCDFGHYLTFQK